MRNIYLVGGTTARTDLDNYVSANISKENAIKSMKEWEDSQGDHEDFHIDSIEIDDIEEFKKKIVETIIDEFAHKLKEAFNNEFPIDLHCIEKFFSLDDVRIMVDRVSRQMKEEKHDKD